MPMTKAERADLLKICRARERVARTEAGKRAEKLRADFEAQIAAQYSYDQHDVWKAAVTAADAVVKEADQQIPQRFLKLGIPTEFRPSLHLSPYGRGENAASDRRTELRRVAYARIDSLEADAKAQITRASVLAQVQLIADALESEAAKKWLESLPTAEMLMPTLALVDIEQQAGPPRRIES